MAEYRVRTDVYNGPMDLLLYLIRRDEIDIYDIPISHITQQYAQYVEVLSVIDPNVAGDFLVMAAMLMEIKSRLLLPHPTAEDGEGEDLADPRTELVRQLLEYKRFKDASVELGAAARQQALRWPRIPARIARQHAPEVDLDDVQIWDLVGAFNKLMSEIGAGLASHDVIFDDTPIALHAADISDRLVADDGEMDFADLFVGRNKVEMIGLFLALLELMRQHRIRVTQAGIFAPIRIVLISAEPIQVGQEWEPAIREAVLGSGPDELEHATTDISSDSALNQAPETNIENGQE
ncbi:MAG: segregation/condensation protein A [Phycisphaerae bacterium]|nr:segregation/condensation protein A [Phycisphaerae bacterium]